MAIGDIIRRYFGFEKWARRQLPITAVAPLVAQSTPNGTVIRDTRTAGYLEDFDGWITTTGPNGEKDYPDARYFCHKGLATPNVAETDALTFDKAPPNTDDKGKSLKDDIVTVTNEPELQYNTNETSSSPTQTHYLSPGRHVRVRAVYASDGTKHYVMNETLANSGFCSVITNAATVSSDYGSATLSNRATLKYDVTPFGSSGGTIAANVAPYSSPGRAFKQKVTAASVGTYFYNGTVVVLYDVNEFADDQLNCT